MPSPETTASTPQASIASRTRIVRCSTCSCMSATSSRDTSPASSKSAVARSGSSVWTWTLSVCGVADDEHRVAEALEPGDPRRRLEPLARDREVRAVAVGRGGVLRVRDAGGRVVLERRRVGPAQRRDHAREDDRQAVAAGVHDAGLAQDRQQLRAALDRGLAGVQRVLEHVGEHLVLRRVVDAVLQARLVHVRDLTRRAGGHLSHDREDRALGGVSHGAVRAVGRAGHGGGDQHRVHELAGPADQLLGGAADELGEDHAGVAAGAEQRRAGHGVDDLVAPDLVDVALRGEVVELGAARRAASAPCCRRCRRRRPGRR